MPLSFDELRQANVKRCEATFHAGGLKEWTPTDWATAMAGECGEACNEVKKLRRIAPDPETLAAGRNVPSQWSDGDYQYSAHLHAVAEELADLVTYADLLAARLGINLGDAVAEKFNAISERVGSDVRLPVLEDIVEE